ncbi:T9SS type A sorting domain-containing protein [Flavobacterium sp. CYK-4]|uniref:T9SS type A sorting domain-containing protein n=1 Tax=Flavobacterium lotistagni TaxID=2709660 RepID=UPI00140D8727|nr:T9SS type A sorting domain-containing protein [Flavobacterium lotistagni]NHM07172.1 T9SS type A sorting domain-containing protein [Flavobacterium lotistagni]
MKTNYTVFKMLALTLLFTCNSWAQATIAQWRFNGADANSIPGGGSAPLVSLGAGTAELIGGTTGAFAAGNASAETTETEPTATNFGWQTTGYAPAGTDNKVRGVQYNVSSVGQAGIVFKFEQRLSNSASNTYVVLYTADRTAASPVWVEAQTFTFTPAATGTGDTWYNGRTVDVSSVTALDNNPNIAFKIVSAFDPIVGDYVAARSTNVYSAGTGGTVRYDMVTVTSNVTLGVSQFEANDKSLRVYPNPSNKEIVTLSQTEDITVSDVTGKVILTAKNTSTIDTRSFNRGVYFIKTASGATAKLMVN